MFQFYINPTFEGQNSLNWIPIIIQLFTLAVAAFAVYTARESLNGVSRTQSVQSHMNLITLENEVTKNSENLRMASSKHRKTTDTDKDAKELDLALLIDAVDNAFVLYISSADKFASFINADYLQKQFQKKDWKTEYKTIFDRARTYFNNGSYGDMAASKESQMIRNITILLERWDGENALTTQESEKASTIVEMIVQDGFDMNTVKNVLEEATLGVVKDKKRAFCDRMSSLFLNIILNRLNELGVKAKENAVISRKLYQN